MTVFVEGLRNIQLGGQKQERVKKSQAFRMTALLGAKSIALGERGEQEDGQNEPEDRM
jgi:hypothetical protein